MLTGLIEFLSLKNFDLTWKEAATQSFVFGYLNKFITQLSDFCSQLTKAYSIIAWLQKISFLVITILFASLPLPQFANDKQGLAGILLIALFFWLASKLFSHGKIAFSSSIDLLIAIFFAINIIATFSSHYFAASVHGLSKLFIYILAYFLFSALLRNNPKRQFILIAVLLLSGALVSLYGLYQYKIGVAPLATWEDPNIETQATRIYATFNNPNLLAGYLVPIVMLSASLALAVLIQRRWLLSTFSIALTALLTLALLLTGSRGAYLGIAAGYISLAGVGASILWHKGKRMRWLLIALIAVIPLLVAAIFHKLPGFEQRIVSIFSGREHSSNSFRLNVWLSSLAMFKDNWLIGVGVGNQAFRLAYGLYMRSGFDALGTYCVPLEIAVETGIFGLFAFAGIIISSLARAHLFFWSEAEEPSTALNLISSKYLVLGAAIGLIALSVHGFVDTVFFRPQVQFIFFLLLSILASNTLYKVSK